MRKEKGYILTPNLVEEYAIYLREHERAENTVQKYIRDLNKLLDFSPKGRLSKAVLLDWKKHMMEKYMPSSINSMLAAVNHFLSFVGWHDLKVQPLKIQRVLFRDERRELNKAEYVRLVKTAEQYKNKRLSLIIQTICATGIRISELPFITVEAVKQGRTEVANKGKRRTILLPEKLCCLLKEYFREEKITAGMVFVTRTGKPLDRSNIWRAMKALCKNAGIEPQKVFPHNLRHLFARTYYTLEKDITRLADILGHTNVNTTRIYTAESGSVHVRQIGRLELVLT